MNILSLNRWRVKRFTKQACLENAVASFFPLKIYIYIYVLFKFCIKFSSVWNYNCTVFIYIIKSFILWYKSFKLLDKINTLRKLKLYQIFSVKAGNIMRFYASYWITTLLCFCFRNLWMKMILQENLAANIIFLFIIGITRMAGSLIKGRNTMAFCYWFIKIIIISLLVWLILIVVPWQATWSIWHCSCCILWLLNT